MVFLISRSWRPLLWAASIALTGQAALAADSLAGHYRLHEGPDVASELVLKPDGKFEYFLMAGSLDEQSQGTWRADGKSLRLTTLPKPVPAVFSRGPVSSTKDGKLVLHVTNRAGRGIAGVDFAVGFDSGAPATGYTQEYGWTLDERERRVPRWIVLGLPIYKLESPRFPIDLSAGNELTFILTPNDLGTIDFTGMQIDIEPHRLVMHRNGALVPFDETQ